MHALTMISRRNELVIRAEFDEAIRDGHLELARRIANANPDLRLTLPVEIPLSENGRPRAPKEV